MFQVVLTQLRLESTAFKQSVPACNMSTSEALRDAMLTGCCMAPLADVVLYLGDVCPTLVSFVDCYPPAAQHLLQACSAQHTGASSSSSKSVAHAAAAFGESAHAHALLGILAGLHDKLLPQMGQALQNTKACEVGISGRGGY